MAKYAPRGLSAEAQRLFRETVTQNALDQIDDAASLTLLENACRALMRLRAAEAVIAKEGQTVMDRFGQLKPHPIGCQDRRRRPDHSPIARGDHEPSSGGVL